MQPLPPTIYTCPHCGAFYKRRIKVNSQPPTVIAVWSDLEEELNWSSPIHDPVIHCDSCQKFFTTFTSCVDDRFDWAVIDTFPTPKQLSISDTLGLLNEYELKRDLGKKMIFLRESCKYEYDPTQTEEDIFRHADYIIRNLIVRKLNDEIRQNGYAAFSDEKHFLLRDNASEALALMPDYGDDPPSLIWKAELLRYIGEFNKSKTVLRRINDSSLFGAKRKLLFLNLTRNRKLVLLWAQGGFLSRLRIWRSWIG